ncbi:MAG: tRNA lysidine(34) synthetase TilS [Pontibacterium sp.]
MSALIETAFSQAVKPMSSVRRWLIGHSGGLDSQVLLHLAYATLPCDQLLVVHVNHHLQPEADQWAEFSAGQACTRHLKHQILHACPSGASEGQARDARYAAFESLLKAGDCLLLAHHGDDQAETLLYRLMRGAGLKGLAGIPAQRVLSEARILRPLLQVPRQQLETYASRHQLEWIDDPSNKDTAYDRNYLRHEILPKLAKRWPGFQTRWINTAKQLADTEQVLNQYLDADLDQLSGDMGEIRIPALLLVSREKRYLLLRRWLERISDSLLNQKQLQQIENQILNARNDASPELCLGDKILRRYRQALYLTSPVISQRESRVSLSAGQHVLSDAILRIEPAEVGLVSLDGVQLVRRQGGERCRPAGRGGSCSVKKCLQEAGIPPWLKQDWPLLVAGDEIVAIPGICVCEGWLSKKGGFALSWHSFALSKSR